MRAFAERPGLEPKYIIENYPWSSLSIGATGGCSKFLGSSLFSYTALLLANVETQKWWTSVDLTA